MPALVVLTTTPDLKAAKVLAKLLVLKKAAACVSFREGFTSFYSEHGKMEESHETMLFVKTTQRKFSKVQNLIQRNHPYVVPEILAIPVVRGSAQYLSWLSKFLK